LCLGSAKSVPPSAIDICSEFSVGRRLILLAGMSATRCALSKGHQMIARSSLVTEPKSCCAPQRADSGDCAKRDGESKISPKQNGSTNGMRLISGGDLLMGSETDPPVPQVEVAAFHIEPTCVTNGQFNE